MTDLKDEERPVVVGVAGVAGVVAVNLALSQTTDALRRHRNTMVSIFSIMTVNPPSTWEDFSQTHLWHTLP